MSIVVAGIAKAAQEFKKNWGTVLARSSALQASLGPLMRMKEGVIQKKNSIAAKLQQRMLDGGAARGRRREGALYQATGDAAVDQLMDRLFGIPQYYGGVRKSEQAAQAEQSGDVTKIGQTGWLCGLVRRIKQTVTGALGRLRVFHDHRVLNGIENATIPGLVRNLFAYGARGGATEEAWPQFTKLRSEVADRALAGGLSSVELILEDVRRCEILGIEMKNVKKVIKAAAECTVRAVGTDRAGESRGITSNYGLTFEFVKGPDGSWVCNNFTYEGL